MRFLLILAIGLFYTSAYPQSNVMFDTLSRTTFIYDSTGLTEKIQFENYIGYKETVTGYHHNGNKSYQYTYSGNIITDTLYQWSESGHLKHIEIYSDTGYAEIDFSIDSGTIIQKGEFRYGSYTENLVLIDSTGMIRYRSAWCDSGCTFPIGIWHTFYNNGMIKSEGSYLPYNMRECEYSTGAIPEDQCGNKDAFTWIIIEKETKVRDGNWVFYNEYGEKIREEYYEGGFLKSTIVFD